MNTLRSFLYCLNLQRLFHTGPSVAFNHRFLLELGSKIPLTPGCERS